MCSLQKDLFKFNKNCIQKNDECFDQIAFQIGLAISMKTTI